jgi:hypothetical protein
MSATDLPSASASSSSSSRELALAEHDEVDRREREQRPGIERGLHAARHEQRIGLRALGDVREREVVAQRHPGGGHADEIEALLREHGAQRVLRSAITAVRIEHLRRVTGSAQHAAQTPDAERRREEGVLAAHRVVGANE